MDCPPNHPGGLADVGHEHDRHTWSASSEGGAAVLVMENDEPGSALRGMRKTVTLRGGAAALEVCYERLGEAGVSTVVCLSPDYLSLLREGRSRLHEQMGSSWRGWSLGAASVWVAIDPSEESILDVPDPAEAGHGLNLRVTMRSAHGHLVIGCGTPVSSVALSCPAEPLTTLLVGAGE